MLVTGLAVVGSSAFRVWLTHQRVLGRFRRPVVICGTNSEAADLRQLLVDQPDFGVEVVGIAGDSAEAALHGLGDIYVGDLNTAAGAAVGLHATGVLIAVSGLEGDELNRLIRQMLPTGLHIQMTPGIAGVDHRRLRTQNLGHQPLLYLEPSRLKWWQLATKRTLDIVLGLVSLVASAFVVLPAMLAVKLQDGGPSLFTQDRMGRGGRPFRIYKIRTMVTDAEARRDELVASNERGGPLFKVDDDPRFTRIGKLLDRTSINELPQLWNVVRGDMSLVGPRPALLDEAEAFDDELLGRSAVRPGITGLWQVEARDNPSFDAYRSYDLFYVENWSVALDLVVMVATAETVVARVVQSLLRRSAEID